MNDNSPLAFDCPQLSGSGQAILHGEQMAVGAEKFWRPRIGKRSLGRPPMSQTDGLVKAADSLTSPPS
ncbi:hypothetical protein MSG28_006478 [Choristoneura fumiferana]|uniref:Uncharacterized protein n=1 Tax=Choristoneura fumiferana TaxID=7141 RepID=A0ACC0JF49_CHOFU|nr:hypothetical protein MSG28_006478 [Choristoneura fumiferana]